MARSNARLVEGVCTSRKAFAFPTGRLTGAPLRRHPLSASRFFANLEAAPRNDAGGWMRRAINKISWTSGAWHRAARQ